MQNRHAHRDAHFDLFANDAVRGIVGKGVGNFGVADNGTWIHDNHIGFRRFQPVMVQPIARVVIGGRHAEGAGFEALALDTLGHDHIRACDAGFDILAGLQTKSAEFLRHQSGWGDGADRVAIAAHQPNERSGNAAM